MFEIFSVFMFMAVGAMLLVAALTVGFLLKMVFKIAFFPIKLVGGLILAVLGLLFAIPILVVVVPVAVIALPLILICSIVFALCAVCWVAFHALAWIF